MLIKTEQIDAKVIEQSQQARKYGGEQECAHWPAQIDLAAGEGEDDEGIGAERQQPLIAVVLPPEDIAGIFAQERAYKADQKERKQ